MENILPPERCTTMAEVRQAIDALDPRLVALLGERFAYMRAAARIKTRREDVRDEARKAAVIAAAKAQARVQGVPEDLAEALWERLVEASIAYELADWERHHRL